MVTVSKRKKEKVESAPQVEQKNLEALSPDHLLLLETKGRDVQNAKLLMAVEEQALANSELRLKLLISNIEKQKLIVAERAAQYDLEQKRYTQIKKEIWPIYGFKENEGLGYNPITGQIVRN